LNSTIAQVERTPFGNFDFVSLIFRTIAALPWYCPEFIRTTNPVFNSNPSDGEFASTGNWIMISGFSNFLTS